MTDISNETLDEVERALAKGGGVCVAMDLISEREFDRRRALEVLEIINAALARLREERRT